jgi:hypothetical protein
MGLHMVIKLLARELALADFVLVLVRRNAVLGDTIAMTIFNRFGDVVGIGGFVAVPWLCGIWGCLGGWSGGRSGRRSGGRRRGGGGIGGIVDGCSADGGGCGEPRGS